MKDKIMPVMIIIGMLLIAVGIVMPLLTMDIRSDAFRYVYAAGAILLVTGRIFSPYTGDNMRLKRLYRLQGWSALFFCAAAFMLFYDKTILRDSLAFTLAGGVIQIYTSIMITYIENKKIENKKIENKKM